MKIKRVNMQIVSDAIREYETTDQPYTEIISKYCINRNAFFYHLRKHRTNNLQQGGTPTTTLKAPSIELDADRNKLISLNTNSKKMREYIKQHDMSSALSSTQSEKQKRKPERVDLDKNFEGL